MPFDWLWLVNFGGKRWVQVFACGLQPRHPAWIRSGRLLGNGLADTTPLPPRVRSGRLAMIAVAGFVAQELVIKQGIFEHLALRLEQKVGLE